MVLGKPSTPYRTKDVSLQFHPLNTFSCTPFISMIFSHFRSPRLKHSFTLATVKGDNLFDKLDLLKVCTSLVLLTSVEGIDDDGKVALSSLMSQGIPAVSVLVTDIATLPPKVSHFCCGFNAGIYVV